MDVGANDELQKRAEKAARLYTRSALVLLCRRSESGAILDHGSGTLFRGSNGSTSVLTAKHVLEDHVSCTVLSPLGLQCRVFNAEIIEHPTDDIALMRMTDTKFAPLALGLEVLADDAPPHKGAPVVVSGFPKQISFRDEDTHGPIQRYADLSYFTTIVGSDAQALSIEWREADMSPEDAAPFHRIGIQPGRAPLKKPSGISGGAVWQWTKAAGADLWSPQSNLRFLAVPHEYARQRQLAVPVWRWNEWLHSLLE